MRSMCVCMHNIPHFLTLPLLIMIIIIFKTSLGALNGFMLPLTANYNAIFEGKEPLYIDYS